MHFLLFFFALQTLHSAVAADNSTIYSQNPFVITDAVFVSGTGISRYEISSLEKSWNALLEAQTFEPVVVGDAVLVGMTGGQGADHVEYCIGCHLAREVHDHLYFVPDSYRPGK